MDRLCHTHATATRAAPARIPATLRYSQQFRYVVPFREAVSSNATTR
ncbi:MAG TPA: hypothetical protein VEK05_11770 [Burkholderiales bacterium]|nr:hypothetical protein [Burkholderiales bacterium]